MKKFFKLFSKLTPHVISLCMLLSAISGHYFMGTISLFEFWTLVGLSQIISSLASFFDAIESSIEEVEQHNSENSQINS